MAMAAYDIISNDAAKSCHGLEPWHDFAQPTAALGKAGFIVGRKVFRCNFAGYCREKRLQRT